MLNGATIVSWVIQVDADRQKVGSAGFSQSVDLGDSFS